MVLNALNLFHGTVAVNRAQSCMLFTSLLEVLVLLFFFKKSYIFICIRYCLFKNIARKLLTACYVFSHLVRDAAHQLF